MHQETLDQGARAVETCDTQPGTRGDGSKEEDLAARAVEKILIRSHAAQAGSQATCMYTVAVVVS